ncbi:MAG: DMT family transporter [Flavobacteriales bacterium]|jgi:drug/metabolite transporter (DMT)-like permease|nr:DMT family transporter [Flavobacteriales bacterium]
MKAHIALFSVNLIYALSYGISKEIMGEYIPSSLFILFRVLGAGLLFWLFFFKTEKIQTVDYFKIALAAAFGIAFNKLLLYEGLGHTSAINTSIIMVSSPILVLIIASFLLRERLSFLKITGVTIGLTGAISLILFGNQTETGQVNWYGDALILLNATLYSFYLVIIKPLMNKYSPYTFVKWAFTFGLIYVLPFGIAEMPNANWDMPLDVILKIIAVVFFATFCTYLFTVYAITKVSPTVVSSYIYLQPIFATLFGIYFGTESISTFKIICGLAIFIGVYLIGLTPKKALTTPKNA